jgi:hypothetical protein
MAKILPNPKSNSSLMTRGQRRAWLALQEQKRRRARAVALNLPAIVLSSDGHGRLTWTMNFETNIGFVIYYSADGLTWDGDSVDGAENSERTADESGIAGYFRISPCDDGGYGIPPYSNAVCSDGL